MTRTHKGSEPQSVLLSGGRACRWVPNAWKHALQRSPSEPQRSGQPVLMLGLILACAVFIFHLVGLHVLVVEVEEFTDALDVGAVGLVV